MKKELLGIIIFISLFCKVCASQEKHVIGSFILTTRAYNEKPQLHPILKFESIIKIYLFDNYSIQEIIKTDETVDSITKKILSVERKHYLFVDFKKGVVKIFNTFSDTSNYVKLYKLDPKTPHEGWYYNSQYLEIDSKPIKISDTTIKAVLYKRIKFQQKAYNKNKLYTIGYLQQSNSLKFISFEKEYSTLNHLSMTKWFGFIGGDSNPKVSQEISEIKDELSSNEINVFNSWINKD